MRYFYGPLYYQSILHAQKRNLKSLPKPYIESVCWVGWVPSRHSVPYTPAYLSTKLDIIACVYPLVYPIPMQCRHVCVPLPFFVNFKSLQVGKPHRNMKFRIKQIKLSNELESSISCNLI